MNLNFEGQGQGQGQAITNASRKKPLAPVASLPQLPKKNLTIEEKVDYLELMLLMQSKQITIILKALTE